MHIDCCSIFSDRLIKFEIRSPFWGCSSAGRAPALQAGGQGFDSPHLHQSERYRQPNKGGNEERAMTANDLSRRPVAQVARARA